MEHPAVARTVAGSIPAGLAHATLSSVALRRARGAPLTSRRRCGRWRLRHQLGEWTGHCRHRWEQRQGARLITGETKLRGSRTSEHARRLPRSSSGDLTGLQIRRLRAPRVRVPPSAVRTTAAHAVVAQRTRAPGFEPGGREFESLRRHSSARRAHARPDRGWCKRFGTRGREPLRAGSRPVPLTRLLRIWFLACGRSRSVVWRARLESPRDSRTPTPRR